ncbi:MAG: T3SS effector HopA1 family protein [Arcicella sp.]|nr:T3SS effector HopA1 family protein [Arcicella sp.]
METIKVDIETILTNIKIEKTEVNSLVFVATNPIDGQEVKVTEGNNLNELIQSLSNDVIYSLFYKKLRKLISNEDSDFTEKFKAKFIEHKGVFQEGWTVEKEADLNGNVIIKKYNYDYKLSLAGSYLIEDYPIRNGIAISPQWFTISQIKNNDIVSVARKNEQDCYIHYSGNHLPDNYNDVSSNIRFYFNLNCEANEFDTKIFDFINFLFRSVNERYVPFLFKIIRFKSKFNRADSAVLYINNRHYYAIIDIIKSISFKFSEILGEDTVMFAQKIGKGIGFAEQPPFDKNDELSFLEITSFGMHRSEVIAKAIVELLKNNEELNYDNIEKILISYSKKSYSNLTNFHLNYTINKYNSRYFTTNYVENIQTENLKYAEKIAYKLYSESFWDFMRRCNWISLHENKSYQTLDIDLVEGLAGMCVFLYYLASITQKEVHHTFLAGTMKTLDYKMADKYEWSDKNGMKKTLRNGYFKGDLMAIYILRKFGYSKYMNDNTFYDPQKVVNRIMNTEGKLGLWDGQSGTIISLLKLYSLDNNIGCYRTKAVELGDEFLQMDSIDRLEHNFNGTCGVILALLSLHQDTQDEKYLMKAKFFLEAEDNEKVIFDFLEETRPYIGEVMVDTIICRHIYKDFVEDGFNNQKYASGLKSLKEKLYNSGLFVKDKIHFNFINSELNQKLNDNLFEANFFQQIYEYIDKDIVVCDSKSEENRIGFRPNLFDGYAGLGYFLLQNEKNDIKFPSIIFPFFKGEESL